MAFSILFDTLRFNTADYVSINAHAFTPHQNSLSQNYPNPFNPSTTLNYVLEHSGPVRLDIFDVRGRHVQTLVSAEQIAGQHTSIWSGIDTNGQQVATGVYFARLQAGNYAQTIKMVLLR